jgi:hypothetical protein
MPDVKVIQQAFAQPDLLVTATEPPDDGSVTLQPSSDRLTQ